MNIWEFLKNNYPSQVESKERVMAMVGYQFKHEATLLEALTHSSATTVYDHNTKDEASKTCRLLSNERLEFLGDSILGAILSNALMTHREKYPEGDLSRIRSSLVNEYFLAGLSRKIGLENCLIMSPGEEKSGGKNRDSVLADVFEALIGAIYIDAGYTVTEKIILDLYKPYLTGSLRKFLGRDFKSKLQEVTQSVFKQTPHYEVVAVSGPEHNLKFEVEVTFNHMVLGRGIGLSKKKASQVAAMTALVNIKKNVDLLGHAPLEPKEVM